MTDILIRICVGACGLIVVVVANQVMKDEYTFKPVACLGIGYLAGLITILRALGVL